MGEVRTLPYLPARMATLLHSVHSAWAAMLGQHIPRTLVLRGTNSCSSSRLCFCCFRIDDHFALVTYLGSYLTTAPSLTSSPVICLFCLFFFSPVPIQPTTTITKTTFTNKFILKIICFCKLKPTWNHPHHTIPHPRYSSCSCLTTRHLARLRVTIAPHQLSHFDRNDRPKRLLHNNSHQPRNKKCLHNSLLPSPSRPAAASFNS